MGDALGPRLFSEKLMAQAAAMVVDKRMGWRAGRTRAYAYEEQSVRPKDSVTPQMSSFEALQRLERGEL